MLLNKIFYILIFLSFSLVINGQNCAITIKGKVVDSDTQDPLEAVSIYIQEAKVGAITDKDGRFSINQICPGDYHIVFSHIGCETIQDFVSISSDTSLVKSMEHSAHVLHHVVVKGQAQNESSQHTEFINEQDIQDRSNESLASMLETITGVSTIKNGSGISKPVVHGLYGNRLTILNNGVSQSGQQWGADHAPEIDAQTAGNIRVVKGTSSLEYLGANLGSVILIEPKKIGKEPHLHGRFSYFHETNGRNNGVNFQAQQYTKFAGLKINTSYKKAGDRKSARYFLNNTGNEELNFALQLEKNISDHWFIDLYASTFNSKLGVLRGSIIGNTTDLEEALSRDIPLFTDDQFSYNIDVPRQGVSHHLIKLKSKYFFNDTRWLETTIAGQYNNRKEFDLRKNGKSDIPALSLQQLTLFSEIIYQQEWDNDFSWKSGIQHQFIDNTNNPETEVLPLIPDYFSYETGLYSVISKKIKNHFFDFGLRYDNALQNVVFLSNSFPREVLRFSNDFHNFGTSIGYLYSINEHLALNANVGYSSRNPAVNELYSGGLHQSVSGIEEGDPDLNLEKAIKTTMGFDANISHFSIEALAYYQRINDYIYLQPQDELRLTIRGAFPVFKYEQTNAELLGLDISSRIEFSEHFYSEIKYSFLQANDLSNSLSLINIPSNNAFGSLVYQFKRPITILNLKFENVELQLDNTYVFQRKSISIEQDFVLPPPSYNLLGANIVAEVQIKNTRWRLTAKVDNMLNVQYRDYLNRQRYFADDLGINATFGIAMKF